MIVLLSGMGAALYTLTAFMEYGFELVIGTDYRKRRKMARSIASMKDHVIICGYGRVGHTAAATLNAGGIDVVIVDRDPEAVKDAIEHDIPVVEGDATRDEVLLEAGIDRARSIIACVESSSDNLVITLSSKALRKDISVTARAVDSETEKKLNLAGADAVVTPELVGGARMALLATRPDFAKFIETVVDDTGHEYRIERFQIDDGSPCVGKSLLELDLRGRAGAMIVGVSRDGGPMRVNPDPTEPFRIGDGAYALGTKDQLARLRLLFEAD
jgi:voltage-gated potassium channel